MKRRIVLSFAALTLASAIVGAGGIDARSTAGSASDFVLASFDDGTTHHFITAWSGPAGGKAQGVFLTSIPWLKGEVRCLGVHRHEALVIADNRELRFVVMLALRDNRPGPDELLWVDFREGSAPRPCPPFDGTDGRPGTPVSGDVWVHDGREP